MASIGKIVWNLLRLGLGVACLVLLVVCGLYLFQGRYVAASAMAALMLTLFFSINITNFWQYRWRRSGASSKALVVAPFILSLVAVGIAMWTSAVGGFLAVAAVIAIWFVITYLRPDLASSRVPARLLITDKGVRRMYANVQLDSIDWEELVAISVSTTADGKIPLEDDFFFFLEGEREDECIVPNTYATQLLPRLQNLPQFDNEALVEAATDESGERRVVWEGKPGQARVCGQ